MDIMRYEARPEWSLFEDWFPLNKTERRWMGGTEGFGYSRYPLVNLWHSDDEVVVDAELPGVDPQKVEVTVTDNELTLSGERPAAETKPSEIYHRRERPYGKFSRTIVLPFSAESGKVGASYRNGILRIVVPRAEADKPRKIAIEAA